MKHPFEEEVKKVRRNDYSIQSLILNRWSPRSMTGEEMRTDKELMALFDAARWAPSSFNNQPWRFMLRKTPLPGLYFSISWSISTRVG